MVRSLYKNWVLVSKITGIWTTSNKQWKVQKAEIWLATFVQKIHSVSKKRIQRIYLTLLSTTCVESHQITCVVFETIASHFSWHSPVFFSSVFFNSFIFSSNITYSLQKYPIKVQIFRLSTAQVKVHQIPHVIFQIKSQFFFKVLDLFSVLWELILYIFS